MNEITRNAMLTRWHRMAEAGTTGAYDVYSFLKGAIEYAGNADNFDTWEDTPYCNDDFSDLEEYIFGSKVGGYLYAGLDLSTIPTYREVWANMNRPP